MKLDTHKQRTATVAWNSEIAYTKRQWNNWIYRTQVEIRHSVRTWFVTLTFRNSSYRGLHILAKERFCGIDGTPTVNIKDAVVKLANMEVHNYIRRIKSAFNVRYIQTIEYGTLKGRLHYHLFLHFDSEVRKAALAGLWSHGFDQFKLVKDYSKSYYICKYLTKTGDRIKCSSKYGLTDLLVLQSKPRLQLLLMTNKKKLFKLIRRYSKTTRVPTPSFLRRWMLSSIPSTHPLQKPLLLKRTHTRTVPQAKPRPPTRLMLATNDKLVEAALGNGTQEGAT